MSSSLWALLARSHRTTHPRSHVVRLSRTLACPPGDTDWPHVMHELQRQLARAPILPCSVSCAKRSSCHALTTAQHNSCRCSCAVVTTVDGNSISSLNLVLVQCPKQAPTPELRKRIQCNQCIPVHEPLMA